MRPIHLTVSGFTAFRQHTEINFEGLDLFALVGPTGSGKSSLLDAMTFALFGQTARLGATGMDALISQGERALSVSLTFEVIDDSGLPQRYRVARAKGRRTAEKGTSFEHLQEDGRWQDLLGGGGARAVTARVQEVLRLDFKTFTRSVFLPQGDFARLLHGTGKERQDLLGELMNLGQVKAMHSYAGDQAKALGFELGSLNTLLQNEYAAVTAEGVQALRTQRQSLSEQLDSWRDEREDTAAALHRWQTVAALWQSKTEVERRLGVQQGRRTEIERSSERAAQARRVAGILPLIDREGHARIAAEREAGELHSARLAAEQTAQAVATAEENHANAKAAEMQIPDLERRAEQLRDAEALAARLKRVGGTPDLTHPQPLEWDEDTHASAKTEADRAEKLRLERVQLASRRAALEASEARLAADEALQVQRQAQLERIKAEGTEAAKRVQQAQETWAAAQAKAGLAAYAQTLREGEACPLCGQPVDAGHIPAHPSAAEVERLHIALQAATTLRDDLRVQYKELAADLGVQQKDLIKRRAEVSDTQAQLTQDETDHRTAAERIAGDPAAQVARLLAGLAAQVRSFGPNPAAERKKALAQVAEIRRQLTASAEALATVRSAQAAAQATLHSAQTVAASRQAEAAEAAEALAQALTLSGLSAETAKAAALPEGEITALEEAAQTWRAGLVNLETQAAEVTEELHTALAGADYDPQTLPTLTARLGRIEAQIATAQSEAGKLAEQEKSAAERLTRKAELEVQTAELSRRMDTWKTLANSLKANEFQQFMLAEVEANLLTGAGHILYDISDGRFRLTLAGADYAVEDLWNAGEVRGVKTLSGGETFLASLSLAIALSDYLAGNRRLGALFLDEGFGTLDPQALEAVAGALENLRTQGRMVGIVTHVESLSEHIGSKLLVSKSVAGSSVLRLDS